MYNRKMHVIERTNGYDERRFALSWVENGDIVNDSLWETDHGTPEYCLTRELAEAIAARWNAGILEG